MKNREYPLFFVDRTKNKRYPHDFVICTHKTCSFTARCIFFKEEVQFRQFVEAQKQITGAEFMSIFKKLRIGGLAIHIIELNPLFDENNLKHIVKIKSLLKRALGYYLHGEVIQAVHGDLGIDKQILQQEHTIERAKINYDDLLARTSEKAEADYIISLAEATLTTLKRYRDIFK